MINQVAEYLVVNLIRIEGSLAIPEVVLQLKNVLSEQDVYRGIRDATQFGILDFDRKMKLFLVKHEN